MYIYIRREAHGLGYGQTIHGIRSNVMKSHTHTHTHTHTHMVFKNSTHTHARAHTRRGCKKYITKNTETVLGSKGAKEVVAKEVVHSDAFMDTGTVLSMLFF
jgi:hypothetical protein